MTQTLGGLQKSIENLEEAAKERRAVLERAKEQHAQTERETAERLAALETLLKEKEAEFQEIEKTNRTIAGQLQYPVKAIAQENSLGEVNKDAGNKEKLPHIRKAFGLEQNTEEIEVVAHIGHLSTNPRNALVPFLGLPKAQKTFGFSQAQTFALYLFQITLVSKIGFFDPRRLFKSESLITAMQKPFADAAQLLLAFATLKAISYILQLASGQRNICSEKATKLREILLDSEARPYLLKSLPRNVAHQLYDPETESILVSEEDTTDQIWARIGSNLAAVEKKIQNTALENEGNLASGTSTLAFGMTFGEKLGILPILFQLGGQRFLHALGQKLNLSQTQIMLIADVLGPIVLNKVGEMANRTPEVQRWMRWVNRGSQEGQFPESRS